MRLLTDLRTKNLGTDQSHQLLFITPINLRGRDAVAMAGITIDDIEHIDQYSCFPRAAEIACGELRIAPDDPRPLTVTSGLPFHGGSGNNYVMNSTSTMADKLST
ncbi:MAG: hypothetical protein CMQ33_09840 [Gammaproteobacteria bacterium]|nr:hypothetical protein [Gammaproteobacteria bacterium]